MLGHGDACDTPASRLHESSTACAGVTLRFDSANTKPMASTRASSAACTASLVVMPHTLMNMVVYSPRDASARSTNAIARWLRLVCRVAFATAFEHFARERVRIEGGHQRASDEREVVAGGSDAASVFAVADAALGNARNAGRQQMSELFETTRAPL